MSKRPLSRGQLIVVLVVALGVLAWFVLNRIERDRAARRLATAAPRGTSVVSTPDGSSPDAPGPVVRLTIQPILGGPARRPMYWIRVGDEAWELAPPATGADEAALAAWKQAAAATLEDILESLRMARERHEKPAEVSGEVCPADEVPPNAFVVHLLDLFVEAGYEEVGLELPGLAAGEDD